MPYVSLASLAQHRRWRHLVVSRDLDIPRIDLRMHAFVATGRRLPPRERQDGEPTVRDLIRAKRRVRSVA